MTATPAIAAKGQRLYDEGRVQALGGWPYKVRGDHAFYVVTVIEPKRLDGYCPCPAYGPCSHLFAACLAQLQEEESNARHL